MTTLCRIDGLKIQVYADDHFPPHFHIVGPDFEVLVLIEGLEILKGVRHRREVAKALVWAAENVALIVAEWSRLND